jgi:hypothetical protein
LAKDVFGYLIDSDFSPVEYKPAAPRDALQLTLLSAGWPKFELVGLESLRWRNSRRAHRQSRQE